MNNPLLSQRLQQALGYTFVRADLLVQALTHRSHGAVNNERLEFLGDSVLNCSVARALYDAFPDLPEGSLSRLRANLVRQETLAEIADAGFEAAQRAVRGLFDPLVARIDPRDSGKDPKTELQEILQSRRLPLPDYQLVGTEGEAHDQSFIVECVLAKPVLSTRGVGKSRRAAEQEAARQACAQLQK